MKNYYDVLGLEPGASKEQIKQAYRKLAQKFHPDRNGQSNFHSETFKEINEANKILSNDDSRATYDFELRSHNTYLINYSLNRDEYHRHRSQTTATFKKAAFVVLVIIFLGFVVSEIFEDDGSQYVELPQITNTEQSKVEVLKEGGAIKAVAVTKKTATTLPVVAAKAAKPPTDKPITAPKAVEVEKHVVNSIADKSVTPIHKPAIREPVALTETIKAAILNSINKVKTATNNSISSIRLCKSSSTNLSDSADITGFLRSNGYSIAGRQIVSKPVKGASASAEGAYITLVLGSF